MRLQYCGMATTRVVLLLSVSMTAPAFLATSAFAVEPTVDQQASQLEEVVVTAERRPVDLQKSALSVSAVTAETLTQGNITDITGLNGLVPGLVVARSGGGERVISIRGVGSETPENTNTQPGVSYHVDGVYIFNSIAANAAFIDVAQVEVLRGPQGTMFGQGSTGGTINVVTNKPVLGDYVATVNLGSGNHGLFKGDAAVNVPLGDKFAVRGAVQRYAHDGYAKATGVAGYSDYELDEADETGWKLSSLWTPTDDLSVVLSTIQYKSDTHGPAQKNILDPNPNPRELTQDYPSQSLVDTKLYSAVVKYKLPWATLTSISSYQKLLSKQAWDADALTASLFYAETYSPLTFGGYRYDHVPLWRSRGKSYTQEFNLTSTAEGPFQWIAGAVYLKSTNSQYIVEYNADDNNLVTPPLPEDTAWDDPRVAALSYAELSAITRKSWAAYFQGAYQISDKLSLTAGLRYNDDKYSGEAASNGSATSGAYLQPQPTQGLNTQETTGKLALNYQYTPANMLYASYTRGYKPGGINSSAASGNSYSIKPTFKPEIVDSWRSVRRTAFWVTRCS